MFARPMLFWHVMIFQSPNPPEGA